MTRRWKPQRLSPGEQMLLMQRWFPDMLLVDRRRQVWQGPVTPIEGGREFVLRIESEPVPKVTVVAPALFTEPHAKRPPHTYNDGSLCLYHTDDFRWTGEDALAETIVPWACEWCWYYEQWERTGRWLGPEYPDHGPKRRTLEASERRAA